MVNGADETSLADILYRYGEERASRRIARAIVERRRSAPIERTADLAELVADVLGRRHDRIDPATRTFQALRIHVNDELGELERALQALPSLLAPGGRLVVVSFHSLEDRLAKRFLAEHGDRQARPSRHLPDVPDRPQALFRALSGRAIRPGDAETAANPRARSARLRAALRLPDPLPRRRTRASAMTVKIGLASLSIALVAACALFAMKDQVRRLEGELRELRDAIVGEKVAMGRLETEWAILNQPGRIARLASTHVGLQPAQPGQIVRIDDIPLRSEVELGSRQLQVVLPSGEPTSLRLKPRARLLDHPGLNGPAASGVTP